MLFLVVLLYALFGLTFTLGKIVLWYASPFFVVATRMLVGGFLLGSYAWYKHRVRCSVTKEDFWLMLQFMFFGIYFFYCARSWALQYLTTTKAALLFNLSPFFTALWSYLLHKERLSWQKFIGLSLGFLGMLPSLLATAPQESVLGSIAGISTAELVFITAVAALSYSMLIMQKLVRHRACHPIVINAYCMSIGGVLSLATAWYWEPAFVLPNQLSMFIGVISLQIIVSNLLCSNLQALLLKVYSPTFMAFASFLSPLSAAVYGCLLLQESITPAFALSFVLVFIGLAIFYHDELKQHKAVLPTPPTE